MGRLTVQFPAFSIIFDNRKSLSAAAKFSTCSICNKSNGHNQSKILNKLYGNRVSGSKKRWFENPMPTSQGMQGVNLPLNFTHSKRNDGGTNRRTTVLNKLFMTHITDLLATGEASENILGKGIQITRVRVTSNFQVCNVYWLAKGVTPEGELEEELQKCGGVLRHELSQLRLMGEVPRIYFVKDKTLAKFTLVESALEKCDFGKDHNKTERSLQIKDDFFLRPSGVVRSKDAEDQGDEEPWPEMRHDVFGLNHRQIMMKILAKMKKSDDAWKNRGLVGDITRKVDSDLEKLKQVEKIVKPEKEDSINKFPTRVGGPKRIRMRRVCRSDQQLQYGGDDEFDPLDDGDYIEDLNEKK